MSANAGPCEASRGFRARSIRDWWLSKTGVSWRDYTLIFKGAIAPTIALACFESTAYANLLGPFGYLAPVAAIIAYPMPPQGKFTRMLVLNTLTACVGAAVTLLGMYCVVIARPRMQDGTLASGYNGSASTVAGVWLAFQTFACSAVRARYPEMAFPCSGWLVFSNFGMIYATQYDTVGKEISSFKQLFLANIIGFAVSAGVSIFIFPTTSRAEYFRNVRDFTATTQRILESTFGTGSNAGSTSFTRSLFAADDPLAAKTDTKLSGLLVAMGANVAAATKELAFGTLGTNDLNDLHHHLVQISEPLLSISSIPHTTAQAPGLHAYNEAKCARLQGEYQRLFIEAGGSLSEVASAISSGLDHVLRVIGMDDSRQELFGSGRKGPSSEEPGSTLSKRMKTMTDNKRAILDAWRTIHRADSDQDDHMGGHEPLYVFLHAQVLLWSVAYRVMRCVLFVDSLKAGGKLTKRRMIAPVLSTDPSVISSTNSARKIVERRNDPCHLPPVTSWQKATDPLRLIARFFASTAAGFGLRVTCATMCIAVIGLTPGSQKFYVDQHLIWAQYAVSFAMQPSAGQSLRHFIFRLGGTVVAVFLAWIAWYIVDKSPAGALVFYWVGMHFPTYIMAKAPRFMTVGTVSAFALTIVLGNELQISKFGITVAKQKGLTPEPLYLLGSIRLAAIAGGLLVAYIWTVFPFPLSEHERLRTTLGSCLKFTTRYHRLLYRTAFWNFTTGTPRHDGQSLVHVDSNRARTKLYTTSAAQLRDIHSQLKFLKYNIPVGGPFPRELYEKAVSNVEALLASIQVGASAMDSFTDFAKWNEESSKSQWLSEVQAHVREMEHTNETVTTVLSLLSSSMLAALPLPPFIRVPYPHPLLEGLSKEDADILSIENLAEPGYATLAALRVSERQVYKSVTNLLNIISDLVGVVDFRYEDV